MEFSRYNIFSKLADGSAYFAVNLLTGNADMLDPDSADIFFNNDIEKARKSDEFILRGYVAHRDAEDSLFRKRYLDFLDAREREEIQIFYVPWYDCNFACSYCYQDGYMADHKKPDMHAAEAFFSYVKDEFAGKKKYITLFGGEPLFPGAEYMDFTSGFLRKASDMEIPVSIVTNGYTLSEYIDILKSAQIREIQVTLDGTAEAHDLRRPRKGGGGTFEKITKGISLALGAGFTINLRVVLDRGNIGGLPALAAFAGSQGWTGNPLFKTQIGRNYELHGCQASPERLFSRIEMYAELYLLIKEFPEILDFHAPAFSVSRFLFENGKLPDPLFDSCPGAKTEWAFDSSGAVYSCTATVGKKGGELGRFYPAKEINEEAVREWQKRDVLSIPGCRDCALSLACGGGCAAVAKNRSGHLLEKDCRPVRELLEYGLALYFKN